MGDRSLVPITQTDMKPYKEIEIERRSVWLSVAIGVVAATAAFLAFHELTRDTDLSVLLAGAVGVLTTLLLPERVGSRW